MIYFFNHMDSTNHGCEAIVRTSKNIINDEITLCSMNPQGDIRYGVDKIINIEEDIISCDYRKIDKLIASIYHKLKHSDYLFNKMKRKELISKAKKGDIFVSIGGDNYCYAGYDILADVNKALKKRGVKTVLWGCSVDEGDMPDIMKRDLSTFDLITARETISYEILKKLNKNTYLFSDPAFTLEKQEVSLPENFQKRNMVGINLSPLVLNLRKEDSVILENYVELIKFILENTDMGIVLTPHVTAENNDDRIPLTKLYERFKDTGRVIMLKDSNCMVLKYYISNMRFFIGARTHATIAAYSTEVPTLVVGYSTKSKGIARDLFGSEENYVVNINDMKEKEELKNAFKWIMANENHIKEKLAEKMPVYIESSYKAGEKIKTLMEQY